MSKVLNTTSLLGAAIFAALVSGGSPAVAGLQLEGLKPFHTAYCEGADPSLTDPLIVPPAQAWAKTSPDANTLAGRPAWDASGCQPGKYEGGGRYHGARSAPARNAVPAPVPQK